MDTEALIAKLSATPPLPPINPVRMAAMIAISIVVPLVIFLGLCGTRPNLALAWTNPVVPFKTFLPLVVCLLSGALVLRLTRPEASAGRVPWVYTVPGGIALALWIGTFVLRAPEARFAEVGPAELAECLGIIPLLSIVPTVAALRVLRQGASTSPALSALLAGLMAASGAATGYSLFCTRDNPLFFITWYGAAILIVTLIARHFGRRVLSW
jgi:hypothetical protein